MKFLGAVGSTIKNFMIIFSFIVNLVLIIVLVVLGLLIFDIKNNIAQPLIGGLHSSFVGLDESTIDYTIPVRDRIPVVLNIPLETETVVVLTEPVPLTVSAVINLPGVGVLNNAQVNLQLPEGLELPVMLDLNVPVDEEIDVALDVRAVIPIAETQLHDPITNLRLLFEPLARGLHNLPSDFGEAGPFAQRILDGDLPDLLAENDYSRNPWPGYSQTAGVAYMLSDEPIPLDHIRLETGVVPTGGIPLLDELLRPEIYEQGGPEAVNAQAEARLTELGIDGFFYNGDYAAQQAGAVATPEVDAPDNADSSIETDTSTADTGEPIADSETGEATLVSVDDVLAPQSTTVAPEQSAALTATPMPTPEDQGILPAE